MIEIIQTICAIILVMFLIYAVYVSSQILEDRKRNYRNGTHDYYGNKIKNERDDDE